MSDKYTELEKEIITNYNLNPDSLSKDDISNIKEKQMQKSYEFLSKLIAGYENKKDKLDLIDPTYYIEVVDPELKKIKDILDGYNPKQIPLDFFEKSFKKTIETAQLKMNYELEARVNYIKVMNQLNNQ